MAIALLSASACAQNEVVEAPPSAALQERVAADYPGWTVVSISRNGSEQHFVRLKHPERDLQFSVRYTTWTGYIFTSEQTLREGGTFPQGQEALLDYLETAYRDPGCSIGLVEAAPEGMVSVTWARTTQQSIFPSVTEGMDYLEYVEARDCS